MTFRDEMCVTRWKSVGFFASFSFGFVGFHRKRILGGAVSVDLHAPVVASSRFRIWALSSFDLFCFSLFFGLGVV